MEMGGSPAKKANSSKENTMQQHQPNAINGQGLDILEEFGIHVVDKERSSTTTSIIGQSISTFRSKLGQFVPEDELDKIFTPAEDLLKLVEKWNHKTGTSDRFSILISTIITGFIVNPAILDAFILDAAKRTLQSKDQDPAKSIITAIEARSEWKKILGSMKEEA